MLILQWCESNLNLFMENIVTIHFKKKDIYIVELERIQQWSTKQSLEWVDCSTPKKYYNSEC